MTSKICSGQTPSRRRRGGPGGRPTAWHRCRIFISCFYSFTLPNTDFPFFGKLLRQSPDPHGQQARSRDQCTRGQTDIAQRGLDFTAASSDVDPYYIKPKNFYPSASGKITLHGLPEEISLQMSLKKCQNRLRNWICCLTFFHGKRENNLKKTWGFFRKLLHFK